MRIDVDCDNCSAKLLATSSEARDQNRAPTHTVPCPKCGKPVFISFTVSADDSTDYYSDHDWTVELVSLPLERERESQTAEPDGQSSVIMSLAGDMLGTFYQAVEALPEHLPELKTGDRIYHYKLGKSLGMGSNGIVFEAEHIYMKDRVAIKVLKNAPQQQSSNHERFKLRFIREAQTLAAVRGPFSLKIIDASEFEGRPYLVSEILDESNLYDFVIRNGPMTRNQALDLLEQMVEVLCRQERLGIVHRDIKPENIHIRKDGTYCLIDYGLAFIMKTGPARRLWHPELDGHDIGGGTPLFMSPEQADKFLKRDTELIVDHRSDLFSLGLTIWFCLAGKASRSMADGDVQDSIWLDEYPSTAKSMMEFAVSNHTPSIVPLREDLDSGLVKIIESLTSQNPDERYSSAQLLMDDVENYRYGGRRPYGATAGSVFVAMPFAPEFDSLFEAIFESCGKAKLAARRVDRIPSSLGIWDQIEKDLASSKIAIAVFTPDRDRNDPNPNVLTEAAHARAIKKPLLVLTTQAAEDLPFDWRHLSVIRYDPSEKGLKELGTQMKPRLIRILRESNS